MLEADESGFIDLRPVELVEQHPRLADPQFRSLMTRLQRLERMGLATNAGPSQRVISVNAETTLRELATRNYIIKSRVFATPTRSARTGGTGHRCAGSS
jgi:type IV secretory pathway VirD2 relaxase